MDTLSLRGSMTFGGFDEEDLSMDYEHGGQEPSDYGHIGGQNDGDELQSMVDSDITYGGEELMTEQYTAEDIRILPNIIGAGEGVENNSEHKNEKDPEPENNSEHKNEKDPESDNNSERKNETNQIDGPSLPRGDGDYAKNNEDCTGDDEDCTGDCGDCVDADEDCVENDEVPICKCKDGCECVGECECKDGCNCVNKFSIVMGKPGSDSDTEDAKNMKVDKSASDSDDVLEGFASHITSVSGGSEHQLIASRKKVNDILSKLLYNM
jgi:hypothetical protein